MLFVVGWVLLDAFVGWWLSFCSVFVVVRCFLFLVSCLLFVVCCVLCVVCCVLLVVCSFDVGLSVLVYCFSLFPVVLCLVCLLLVVIVCLFIAVC